MNGEFYTKKEVDEKLWGLAIATNAMVKGFLGYMGIGGSINKEVFGVEKQLDPERGYDDLKKQVINALNEKELLKGDVIVVSEKLFAVAQKRTIPFSVILNNDPKKMNDIQREQMAKEMEDLTKLPVNAIDLICSDTYIANNGDEMATLGVFNPNQVAFELAVGIKDKYSVNVDVVVSDTDTGIDVCQMLIGCITIGATPLGATKGLKIYECMRAALAAEFVRGSSNGIPIVVCRPIKRHMYREGVGEFRGYDGRLNAETENGIAFEKTEVQDGL